MKRPLLILAGLALCCFGVIGLKDILTSTSAQSQSSESVVMPVMMPRNETATVMGASRDGKRLVFFSFRDLNGGNPDENSEVFVYDVDSRSIIQITNTQDATDPFVDVLNLNPSISGDGTKIVFHSNAPLGDTPNDLYNYEIYLADLPRGATTATITRLTNTGPDFPGESLERRVTNHDARINDDGSGIVFGSNRRVFNATSLVGPFTADNADGNGEIMVLRWDPAQMRYQYIQVTVSQDRDGIGGVDFNTRQVISGDGMVVAFYSDLNYENRNGDANGEIFLSRYDPASNGFTNIIQVTDTILTDSVGAIIPFCSSITGICYVTSNTLVNAFGFILNPLSSDGRWLVLESAGNLDGGANPNKARNLWLYDTIARSFRRLTNQTASVPPTQDELRRIDYDFGASIDSAGTFISFNTTLNLVPTSPSDVNTDNNDGSLEIFLFDIAGGSFRQLTFTPTLPYPDQRRTGIVTIISDPSVTGDRTVAFNYESRSFLPNAPNAYSPFQVAIRPVTRGAGGATIVNSASLSGPQVARGSLSTVFGSELANSTLNAPSTFPYLVDGVSVKIGNIAAQIISISPTRIDFIMPQGIANGTGLPFTINNNGVQSTGTINVVDSSPGIFTVSGDGTGPPVAGCLTKLPDGTDIYYDPPCLVSGDNVTSILYGLGTGWRNATGDIQVKINDRLLDPVYSGPEGGGGLRDQFNLIIPSDLAGVTNADLSLVVRNTSIESNRTNISFVALRINDNGAGGAAASCLVKTPGMPDVYTTPPCQVSNGSTVGILVLYGFGWRGATSTQVRFEELTLNPIYSGPGAGPLDQMNVILPPELAGRTGLISVIIPGTNLVSNRVSISFLPLP
jgi:uncharacterized protein (TIGR03437 family)